MKELEGKPYTFHFAELPYRDQTDKVQISTANFKYYVDSVRKVVTEVERKTGQKPVMIGHSLGAVIVQSLASSGCVDKAILIAPASPGGVFQITPKMLQVFSWWVTRWGFWKTSSKMPFDHFHRYLLNGWDDESAAMFYQKLVHDSGRVLAQIAFWHSSTFVPAASIACPVLCLAGKRDHIATPALVNNLAQRYRGRYLEYDASHFLFHETEHVKEVAKDISAFVDEMSAVTDRRNAS